MKILAARKAGLDEELIQSAMARKRQLKRELMEQELDPQLKAFTPLIVASQEGHSAVCRELLAAGVQFGFQLLGLSWGILG